MTHIQLSIPTHIPVNNPRPWREWLHLMHARWIMGGVRYGAPKASQDYLGRLEGELKAYKQTGNKEHLVNIGVYSYLESIAPLKSGTHWNTAAPSATRATFGGAKD